MNKMATAFRDNLHLLDDSTGPDEPAVDPTADGGLGRADAKEGKAGARLDARNPFSSDPPRALTWSVRHFGFAGLLGGAFVSGLLRLLHGGRG